MTLLKQREKLILAGRKMFASQLVNASAGNLSARNDNSIIITKSGTNLEELTLNSFVLHTNINSPTPPKYASSEFELHRKIYLNTNSVCVMHAHSPNAVALSIRLESANKIYPSDTESLEFFDFIPIVEAKPASKELADAVSDAAKTSPVVLARSHGVFVHSNHGIDYTLNLLFAVEYSAKILMWARR